MPMHAITGRGEMRSRRRYRLEGYPGTARVAPFTSDAAGASAVDLVGIDRVLRTFYAALSGPPAQQRWDQFRALFEPGSWMRSADGSELPIEQFIQHAHDDERPRTVIEIERAIRVDGALAFVASAYRAIADDGVAALGVNEFLLRKTQSRWRIAGTIADQRTAHDRRADAH